MTWFHEKLYEHHAQRLSMETTLYHWRTEFQDVLIFENAIFGKVLVLDGVVQVTERDNHIYHEMIAHVPLIAHGSARNVLIIGGGDGGTLKEVLKHPVESATLVELDGEVIDLSRRYLPKVSDGAFSDPRANVLVMDGTRFVAETQEKFDAIIIDSTDPVGPRGGVVYSGLLQSLPNLPSSRWDDCGPEWGSVLPAEGTGDRVRAPCRILCRGTALPGTRPDLCRRHAGAGRSRGVPRCIASAGQGPSRAVWSIARKDALLHA